ncbi:MAG: GNAT family N-acetyltransferase [Dehalococcoidia bacterium]|nr:GNAT family N-acetyltransferase [Dehalococcoidia bacterium]
MSLREQGTVNIRRMLRRDIDAVLALGKKISGGRDLLSYRDMASSDVGGPFDLSFVYEVDDKMVGFVLARLAYLMIPFTEVCIIHGMVVDPDYQRRGIGNKLLNVVLDYCHAEGINTIRTLVEEGNNELRRFVERLGFRRSHITNYDKTFES